jgi:hypothetical protein
MIKNFLFRFGFSIGKTTKSNEVKKFINKIKPIQSEHSLIRIGGLGDGGYLIPDDLVGISGCFSPGVSNISTFEDHLASLAIHSYMADYSVDGPPNNNKLFHFVKKFLGSENSDKFIRMEDWISENSLVDSNDYILQMDIEGAEYRVILDSSSDCLKKFRIICIEFHNLQKLFDPVAFELIDLTFEKLLRDFYILHIHPNNCSSIVICDGIEVTPVVEVTFIRKDRVNSIQKNNLIPHPLDVKCVEKNPDILLPSSWLN